MSKTTDLTENKNATRVRIIDQFQSYNVSNSMDYARCDSVLNNLKRAEGLNKKYSLLDYNETKLGGEDLEKKTSNVVE